MFPEIKSNLILRPAELASIRYLIVRGLHTDGSHHKQWYLERIAEALGFNLDRLRQTEYGEWDEGIVP